MLGQDWNFDVEQDDDSVYVNIKKGTKGHKARRGSPVVALAALWLVADREKDVS